ncbi:RNA helicase [Gymnopilus junonius]|uniref:RNA helicase n=1 Tax=Gymnopilus junonius TaxID=109634 RepID=A0A9P5NLB8_GYMJU|nr:RNA helicase [Gymnopilus junonius]
MALALMKRAHSSTTSLTVRPAAAYLEVIMPIKATSSQAGVKEDAIEPQEGLTRGNVKHCDICHVSVPLDAWPSHAQGPKHRSRETYAKYKSVLGETEKDKNGLVVLGDLDLGYVDPHSASLQSDRRRIVEIKSSQVLCHSTLLQVNLAASQGASRIASAFSVAVSGTVRKISSRPLITIGRYEDRVEFLFEDTQLKKRFIISRLLKATVGNKADHEALMPIAPYVPRVRTTRRPVREVVEGIKPPALNAVPYVGHLPKAAIPPQLQTILSSSQSTKQITAQVQKIYIPDVFDSTSYDRLFKHLLWIEECKMEQDLEHYDILNVQLRKHNSYYYLDVPGLAEKRPSVLVGDRILVQEQGATDGRWYEGHVHFVRQAEVGLRFHGSFARYSESSRFHVRFRLNRVPIRRQHQALDTAFNEDRILFPLMGNVSPLLLPQFGQTGMKLYNKIIASNPPQLQAIASIVSLPPGSPPFVVFGPPGTGKTVTIIEAVLQILATNRQAKILACAPSNSAGDLIATRLRTQLNKDTLFRFYAPSRFKDQVPDELRDFTYTTADGHFSVPPMAKMKQFRVIITTCISASVASGIGMPRGHFSHIFIDEAGQATEPEAFVSIKTMADPKMNVILSGDPKQLGPIIRSGIARELGLEKSYLERLMNRDAYHLRTCYGKSVVKLTKNFRSHAAILKFPNERFYDNELEPSATPALINAYINFPLLPSKKFPIIFHSVSGKDDREASSPSFFNIDEVLQIKSYVEQLKADRRFRTTDADIGVIAPYHAQVQKLKKTLRPIAEDVKVGSVEEFQGQERKVILISTVRSSKEFVEYDLKHTLGFVANPRRFNVAVTRAQALLIVVGDPQVLSLDPLWRSFLNYIYLNGGWVGPDIPWDPKATIDEAGGYDKAVRAAAQLDMNEFARRMESLTMAEVEEDVDTNVDRPWRDME